MKASKRRVRRLIYALTAWVVALAVVPTITAVADGTIPVTYEEVEAKSDSSIEGADFCDFSSAASTISGYDQDTAIPGDVSARDGKKCSFISAYYVYQDTNPENNVSMKLEKIETKTTEDKQYAILTPEVSEGAKVSQKRVSLTIPIDSLGKMNTDKYRIVLHYADTSTFRRINLKLSPTSVGAGDNAQPDLNLDGTQFTGTRALLLFNDGQGKYVRDINVDYPRFTKNGIYALNETVTAGSVEFKEVADMSDEDRTRKQFSIVYDAQSNSADAAATLVLSDQSTVDMDADTRTDQAEEFNIIEENPLTNMSFVPQDCGGGGCRGAFEDTWRDAFFYKVTTSRDRARQSNKYYDSIFRRTGIPALPFTSSTEGLWSWENADFFAGMRLDNQPARIIDPTADTPWIKDSVDFQDTGCGLAWNRYACYNDWAWKRGIGGNWSPGWLIDQMFVADKKWPITRKVEGTMGIWDESTSQYREHGREEETYVDPHQKEIGVNDAGKDKDVSFYVQYNGLPARAIMYMDNKGAGDVTKLPNWRSYTWSYFLGRVNLNGEWYDIPFPNFPKDPLPAVPVNGGCYGSGWSNEGCKEGTVGNKYFVARERMLRDVTNEESDNPVNMTAVADVFNKTNYDDYNYRYCKPGTTDPVTGINRLYTTEVLQPRVLFEKEIKTGRNAGSHLKVELVNVRAAGDLLADGFSALDNTGKKISREHRHHPSASFGMPTQLTNNTACFDASKENRNQAMWNQWKTMYKVTVTGMVNPHLTLTAKYDYTSKPKVWVASSRGTSAVEIKESSDRVNDVPIGEFKWRNRTTVPGSLEDIGCDGKKCDGAVGYDMPYANETNDGNIRITPKDGFINPVLTVFKNRNETADCADAGTTNCQVVMPDKKLKNTVASGETTIWPDGKFHYLWKYNNVESEVYNRASDEGSVSIGTATATPIRVDSTVVRTPVVVMKNAQSTARADANTAAGENIVPDQWSAKELKLPTVDKESNYYLKVLGNVPNPQDGKAFTGYKLQGITADSQVEQLMSNRTFYPGDAIDLRDDTSGTPLVKLSNDSFDGPRYQELQLVPTFGAKSNGRPKMYDVKYVVRALDGRKRELDKKAFSFYAAPGLTASIDEANWSPTDNPPEDYKTYVYQPKESSHTNEVFSESDSRYTSNVLKLLYASKDRQVNINAEIQPVTNGYSGLDNSADISNVTLNAWLQHNPDAADAAESSADYTKQLNKGDTTLVVPEANSKRTQADTQKLRESQTLPIQWQWKNALPGYYAVDDWTCTAPGIVTIKVDGKDSETWLPNNPVTFTPDESRDGFGRVTLQDGTVTTCKVTFHTAQITLLTHGLAGKDLSKITGDNTLQAKPSTSDSSATQRAAVASSTGGETLSAANTAFVKPGVKHTLGAPKMVGNAIFKGWQYYKGNNPNAPEMNDDSKWLDVANETITLKKDKHLVYRAVYITVVVPDLPHTGGTAADWFILGGTGLGLLGLMAVLVEMKRRRKAVLA